MLLHIVNDGDSVAMGYKNYYYVVIIVTVVHTYSYGHTMHVDTFVTCMYAIRMSELRNAR